MLSLRDDELLEANWGEQWTSAVGCDVNATVNVDVPPDESVVSPLVGVTVIPATFVVTFVTGTSAGLSPLYFGSLLIAGPVTMA